MSVYDTAAHLVFGAHHHHASCWFSWHFTSFQSISNDVLSSSLQLQPYSTIQIRTLLLSFCIISWWSSTRQRLCGSACMKSPTQPNCGSCCLHGRLFSVTFWRRLESF